MTCNGVSSSSNPSIQTPQVTVVANKKHSKSNHIAIILGATGGALFVLLLVSLAVFMYVKRRATDQVSYTTSM